MDDDKAIIPSHWPSVKQQWVCPGSGKEVATKPSTEYPERVAFDCPDCEHGWTKRRCLPIAQ